MTALLEKRLNDSSIIPFKYIMYAKRNVEPLMSSEAAEVLRNFYIHLRQNYHRANGCNPITMRQLESLIRLTQVRESVYIFES